jgi:alpha-tubulin suppressor-like RCC1 family protein
MRRVAIAALLLIGSSGSVGAIGGCRFSTTPSSKPPAPTPTPVAEPRPAPVTSGVTDPVLEVASRFQHTCVRRKSGTVLCWGRNVYGQIGGNGRADSPRAVKTPVTGASELAVGRDFSCARRATDVLCWGNNEDGQLGDGRGGKPGALSLQPVKVAALGRVTQISAGEYHACALDGAGAVWCWGSAGNGQLGTDAQRAYAKPVRISQLKAAKRISAGANHVCAVESSGTVHCWGRNTEGQLGDGKSGSRIKPVQVAGIEDAVDVVSGHNHSCAIRSGGSVACWGDNAFGQLGPGAGNERKRSTPVAVAGLSGVARAAGGEAHTCAVLTTGRAMCWGGNDQGQAGQKTTVSRIPKPTAVRGVSDAVGLGLGAAHSCAARKTGDVACWGTAEYGALGPYRLI